MKPEPVGRLLKFRRRDSNPGGRRLGQQELLDRKVAEQRQNWLRR